MIEAEALLELADTAAGAELSAALHTLRLEAVPNDRMLDVLRAQYRQLCHEQARMAAVLVEIGRCDAVPGPGAVARTADADPYAVHETRAALRWTRTAAESEHALAEFVLGELPVVFEAWSAGVIDRQRVRVFEQYLFGLTAEQVAVVCAHTVPRAPALTTGQLAALLRRMVIAVDPEAAARWYRQRMRERTVCAYLAPDGTVTLSGTGLPADDAEAACRRVERLAAAAQRAGHPGTVGQIRADVFLGLLDGRFHGLDTDQLVASLIADYQTAGTTGSPNGDDETGDGGTGDGGTGDGGTRDGETRDGETRDDETRDDETRDDETGHGGTGDGETCAPATADGAGMGERGAGDGESSDVRRGVAPTPPRANGRDARSGGAGDQRQGIEIRVALSTLLGEDDRPGEIPGLGPVLAATARARVAMQTRAEWRFAVTDAEGHLLSEGRTGRRPAGSSRTGSPPGGIVELHLFEDLLAQLVGDPARTGVWADVIADIAEQHRDRDQRLVDLDARADDRLPGTALRRHTEIRDRTCSFAGVCRRPAHAAEQDHRRDHAAGGATTTANLGPTCSQDHSLKHEAGWTVAPTADGGVIWHSPLGGSYPTRGEFLCSDLPDPTPVPDDGVDVVPPRPVEGPILRRPPPPPAATDRMRTPQPEDEEPPF